MYVLNTILSTTLGIPATVFYTVLMRNPFSRHKGGFWTPARKRSMYLGIVLIVLALITQVTLGHYSSRQALSGQPVGDIFLDNLPVVNIDFVIVLWNVVLWFFAWWLLVTNPDRLIFGTKAIALFIICRAFFISLTHLGLYPTPVTPGPANTGFTLYQIFNFQGNYFFSGHTGFPFLLALIFWDNKLFRRLFLFLTFFFGASVLLAHVHYSIDVFAAPFIIYGVYVITAKIFQSDYELLPTPRPAQA